MARYELRYESRDHGRPIELAFDEHSLAGALDVARARAQGVWAELWQEGRPLCELELVSGCGVWLVGAPRPARPERRRHTSRQEVRIAVHAA